MKFRERKREGKWKNKEEEISDRKDGGKRI